MNAVHEIPSWWFDALVDRVHLRMYRQVYSFGCFLKGKVKAAVEKMLHETMLELNTIKKDKEEFNLK